MFFYYGGKRRMGGYYAPPMFGTIIEPFAGSAAYSMRYLAHAERIVLVEKDPRVVALWHRLLSMTPAQVRAIPIPTAGERTSDFLYMTAATSNAIANCRSMKVTDRMPKIIATMLNRIALVLPAAQAKVEIVEGDYASAPDIDATWFIDPPYQVTSTTGSAFPQGNGYARNCKASDLDYPALGAWCERRRGQVIVCEQQGADWLPFSTLWRTVNSLSTPLTEVVWTNKEYGQQSLFDVRA